MARKVVKYSEEEMAAWPEGHKRCTGCNLVLPLSAFSKNAKTRLGYANVCRGCSGVAGGGFTKFTLEEELSWPPDHRGCVSCRKVIPFSDFHKHSGCRWGINTTCKACRKGISREAWQRDRDEMRQHVRTRPKTAKKTKTAATASDALAATMWRGARSRATTGGYPFEISMSNIVIPERCPVLGVVMAYGDGMRSPTLDKIDPSLGYVPGNIMVISKKANMMKSSATQEELRMFCDFYAGGRPSKI